MSLSNVQSKRVWFVGNQRHYSVMLLKLLASAQAGDGLITACGDPRNNKAYKFSADVQFKCTLKGCTMKCPSHKTAKITKKFSKVSCKSKKGKTKWSPKKGSFMCV